MRQKRGDIAIISILVSGNYNKMYMVCRVANPIAAKCIQGMKIFPFLNYNSFNNLPKDHAIKTIIKRVIKKIRKVIWIICYLHLHLILIY